jgi:hypothetical protein
VNNDEEMYQQQEQPVSGRGAHFGTGMTEAPGSLDSPGLQQMAQRYKSETPTSMQPTASGNAMSKNQYDATMGGQLGVQNGLSSDQYQISKWINR